MAENGRLAEFLGQLVVIFQQGLQIPRNAQNPNLVRCPGEVSLFITRALPVVLEKVATPKYPERVSAGDRKLADDPVRLICAQPECDPDASTSVFTLYRGILS